MIVIRFAQKNKCSKFTPALISCEHCGDTQTDMYAQDTQEYRTVTLPQRHCNGCGLNSKRQKIETVRA